VDRQGVAIEEKPEPFRVLQRGRYQVGVSWRRRGRAHFERKVAEGKTKKEAVRSLKRQVSNAVYRQLLLDAR